MINRVKLKNINRFSLYKMIGNAYKFMTEGMRFFF